MDHFSAQESLMYAVYFAPRGKYRLLSLGHELAQRHLAPQDKLIGFIGDAGAGKSLLIKGMFPGLELTSDDEGVNVRPLPLLNVGEGGFFGSHTYHLDVRFEMAFTQMHVLAEAVKTAIDKDKRVVIEHFELIYPYLGMNAEILVGIGEEVIVTRPNLFGPLPQDIADIVFSSIRYRKMAHTAEDLTCKVLEEHYHMGHTQSHGDVKHGFVLRFEKKPDIDIKELESKVKAYIDAAVDVSYWDDTHVHIGSGDSFHCTGPRIHVKNTAEIEDFRLVPEYKYDPLLKVYMLAGVVGKEEAADVADLNKLSL